MLAELSFGKETGSIFIGNTPGGLPVENYRLLGSILVSILLGNTEIHFKNFVIIHSPNGLRLTPVYGEISAARYQYITLALQIACDGSLRIGDLKARHIIALGGVRRYVRSTGRIVDPAG